MPVVKSVRTHVCTAVDKLSSLSCLLSSDLYALVAKKNNAMVIHHGYSSYGTQLLSKRQSTSRSTYFKIYNKYLSTQVRPYLETAPLYRVTQPYVRRDQE